MGNSSGLLAPSGEESETVLSEFVSELGLSVLLVSRKTSELVVSPVAWVLPQETSEFVGVRLPEAARHWCPQGCPQPERRPERVFIVGCLGDALARRLEVRVGGAVGGVGGRDVGWMWANK